MSGRRTLSTIGAHRNLKLYARKVSANAVTALLVTPCWARRVVSVAPIMAKVKPDETPRNSAASGADSKQGRRPSGSLLRQPLGQPVVIVDRQRRVVREPLRLVDRLLPRLRCNTRSRNLVVDAPADVLFPRLAAIGPPGVLVGLAVQLAKDIDEAQLIEHTCEPGSLFGQE